MALVLKKAYTGYSWAFNEMADPRVNEYFLMSSLMYPLLIIAGYLYFVKKLGPDLMKNRRPFDIKNILIVYNVIQIIVNFYSFCMLAGEVPILPNWLCVPVDYSYSRAGLLHLHVIHLYFVTKVLDLLDTVFFVLRKSDRQITFLHIYHHCGVLLASWVMVKFVPGGHCIWAGLSNTLVHTIMYGYYLLTVIDKNVGKNVAIKKHLTQLQLVQFVWNIFIYGQLVFNPECRFPKLTSYLMVPQNVMLLFMFGDFYIKSYIKNKNNMNIKEK